MKNPIVILSVLFGLLPGVVLAVDEPVPDDTPLLELPASTRLVVRNLTGERTTINGYDEQTVLENCKSWKYCVGIDSGNADGLKLLYRNDERGLLNGAVLTGAKIVASTLSSRGSFAFDLDFFFPSGSLGTIRISNYQFSTVRELKAAMAPVFTLVHDDPYAGLPDEVVLDVAMKRIIDKMASELHISALADFRKLQSLKGVELPEGFYYFYADSLFRAGQKTDALKYSSNYLQTYGRKGKYYQKVVELMAKF